MARPVQPCMPEAGSPRLATEHPFLLPRGIALRRRLFSWRRSHRPPPACVYWLAGWGQHRIKLTPGLDAEYRCSVPRGRMDKQAEGGVGDPDHGPESAHAPELT